ncbi:hypothetical protein C2I18_13965 [Paenibacillus sp. PK3_47]|nr:hypothetical protein C2I18_13965 [Paenibacillus sp. PK3_47]
MTLSLIQLCHGKPALFPINVLKTGRELNLLQFYSRMQGSGFWSEALYEIQYCDSPLPSGAEVLLSERRRL